MNELVSIIMPSYNTARFIKETIDSVFAQTYQNFELIIVDDCSTDETDEVVAPYLCDARVKYIDDGITLVGDIKILFKTVFKVVKRSDTVREGTVSDLDFGDWLMLHGKITESEYNEKQAEAKELLKL